MSKERQIANVYCFTNSAMVVVFDQNGEQMPELQGKRDEVFPRLAALGFPMERELVAQAASISPRVSQLQAMLIHGQIDDDTLIRLSCESRRLLDAVRQRRVHSAKPKFKKLGSDGDALASYTARLPHDPRASGEDER
jgi:hypothetical protein